MRSMRLGKTVTVMALGVGLALGAGCGSSSGPSYGSADMTASGGDMAKGGGASHTVMVGAGGNSFVPAELTIPAGDTVHWVWAGNGHNVVSGQSATADGKFCSKSDTSCASAPFFPAGTTYDHVFPSAGSFPYFCAPHALSGMTGRITVQ